MRRGRSVSESSAATSIARSGLTINPQWNPYGNTPARSAASEASQVAATGREAALSASRARASQHQRCRHHDGTGVVQPTGLRERQRLLCPHPMRGGAAWSARRIGRVQCHHARELRGEDVEQRQHADRVGSEGQECSSRALAPDNAPDGDARERRQHGDRRAGVRVGRNQRGHDPERPAARSGFASTRASATDQKSAFTIRRTGRVPARTGCRRSRPTNGPAASRRATMSRRPTAIAPPRRRR
jgi:hypothetical protein